jgi:hypothetical protein
LPDIEYTIACEHPINWTQIQRSAGFIHTWCTTCNHPRVLRRENPEPHTVLTVLRGDTIVCLAVDLDAARRWISDEIHGRRDAFPEHLYNSELSVDWYLEHNIFRIEEKEIYT